MATDLELLEAYARGKSEESFAALVSRHLSLVYSAALRQVRSPQLAEEVAQSVFTDLSRNAVKLKPDTILTAWLYQVTRRTAIDVVRREARRQLREQIATEMNTLNTDARSHQSGTMGDGWSQIEPMLDDAMDTLDQADRAAVLLRYFENKSLREVGAALGTSDDAAQKRVSRAVERLREFLAKRGVTVGASGLVVVIAANAVQAAPAGLAVAIATAAALVGTSIATTATAVKTIAMTTMQKALIAATLAAAVGTGIYEARQAANARAEVQTLQQQRTPLTEQVQQLQRERDEAKNRLVALTDEITRVKGNTSELLRLRSLVARLRGESSQINDPSVQTALVWAAKKEKLQKIFAERPDLRIPEMQFLTDAKWLDLVKDLDLDSEAGIRFAIGFARTSAKMSSAPIIQNALKQFMEANNGNLPTDVSQLNPFFDQPIDDAILQRYKILDKEPIRPDGMVLVEKVAGDKWSEPLFAIGPSGTVLAAPPEPVRLTFPQELKLALESYQAQNPRKVPSDFNELRPYITTPEQQAALDKLIKSMADFGK